MIEADVARIAAGLTYTEQCLLHEGCARVAWPFEVQARDRLVAKGLVRRGWFAYRFTPLGLAVKAHLANHSSDPRNMVPVDGGEG